MLASAAAERKQTSLQRHRDIVVCATSAIFARHARSRSEREQVRTALIGLAIASVVVIALIAMAGGGSAPPDWNVRHVLQEPRVISGWVWMWRPLDMLGYDRIAWSRNRRVLTSIRDAVIEVQTVP